MSRPSLRRVPWRMSAEPDAVAPRPGPDEIAFRAWHDASARVFLFPWPVPRRAMTGRVRTPRD
jgi:hypothetical protein